MKVIRHDAVSLVSDVMWARFAQYRFIAGRLDGLRFRVWGLGFRVSGLRFRVEGTLSPTWGAHG